VIKVVAISLCIKHFCPLEVFLFTSYRTLFDIDGPMHPRERENKKNIRKGEVNKEKEL